MSHPVTDLLRADQRSADAVVPAARRAIIEAAENTLRGNAVSIGHFLALHGEQEVLEKGDLQNDARGYLNLRACFQGALAAARTGAALIYAVEVVGEPGDIERMATDPVVKSFEPGFLFRERVIAPPAQRPATFERGCVNEDLLSLEPRLAYQRLLEVAREK